MEPRQKQTASEEHSRSKGVSRSMRGSVCCCLTSEVPASLLREASISLRELHPAEEGSKGRGSQLWSSFTSIGVGRGQDDEASLWRFFDEQLRRRGIGEGGLTGCRRSLVLVVVIRESAAYSRQRTSSSSGETRGGVIWVWPGVATEGSSCCRQASPGGPAGCGQGKGSVLSFIDGSSCSSRQGTRSSQMNGRRGGRRGSPW